MHLKPDLQVTNLASNTPQKLHAKRVNAVAVDKDYLYAATTGTKGNPGAVLRLDVRMGPARPFDDAKTNAAKQAAFFLDPKRGEVAATALAMGRAPNMLSPLKLLSMRHANCIM